MSENIDPSFRDLDCWLDDEISGRLEFGLRVQFPFRFVISRDCLEASSTRIPRSPSIHSVQVQSFPLSLFLFTSQTVYTFRNPFSCFCYCFPPFQFELQKSILGSKVWVFPLVCCILWVCGLGQVCFLFTFQVTQSQIGALISMGFRFKLAS